MSHEVAKTILEQLGGNRFIMMTGAKQFVAEENGVSFRLPTAGGQGVNYTHIVLNDMDTYDLEFGKVRGADFKIVEKVNGIYCDQLRQVFERHTGLATSCNIRMLDQSKPVKVALNGKTQAGTPAQVRQHSRHKSHRRG